MNVKDVMTANVSVCRMQDNLAEVAARMWNDRCGVLPVLDDAGNVTSMITDRDICIALGTRNKLAAGVRVKEVSLPRVFTCKADDEVHEPLKTMVSQNVRRLPVIDAHQKLAGIVSIDDLLQHSRAREGSGGISYQEAVTAVKAILEGRSRKHVQEPAELIATHA